MVAVAFRGVVYKGRENTVLMTVQQTDPVTDITTDVSWSGVTRMTLHVLSYSPSNNKAVEIVALADTDDDSTLIDYSTDGQLVLKLGALQTLASAEIPNGEYLMRIAAWEGALDTEIVHESAHVARLTFVDTDAVT